MTKIVTLRDFKGQIYDFSEKGPNPGQIFPKTAWKWKNWTGGGGAYAKVEQIACVNAST